MPYLKLFLAVYLHFLLEQFFDAVNPIINSPLEISVPYGQSWELSLKDRTTVLSDNANNLTLAGVLTSVTKDNVPPGHTWTVIPLVNNSNQTFGYQVSISANGTRKLWFWCSMHCTYH